ncbi:EAL domain-containing protein (putative c-di-GMP-specific phosphodiesterase class I) [Erwinia rhapontici]|nr:EAL domain-containing protein (putative c-di-GMP-specific phosphodiesterase class I) [Erwinia rhapontici]
MLKSLSESYTLWLGDLGSGEANLKALQDNLFESVKIDNNLQRICKNTEMWLSVLKNVMHFCDFIILEEMIFIYKKIA